jgi:hypothetical protein
MRADPGAAEHELKCWPEFFEDVFTGQKSFEIRRNDCNYQVGDVLVLKEWQPDARSFTGREIRVRVTYLTDFAQQFGHVVMAVVRV